MNENYHLKGFLFPFEEEPIDFWIVNGHITYSEPKEYQNYDQSPVYILPGLVDAHVHLSLDYSKFNTPEFKTTAGNPKIIKSNREGNLQAGVLLLRDIGSSGPNTLLLTREDGLPPVISAGNFLAPAGGFFDIIEYVSPEQLPIIARRQLEQGYEWVKIIGDWIKTDQHTGKNIQFENYPKEAVFETVKVVHQMGGKIAMHATIPASISTAIEAGVDSLEHGQPRGLTKAEIDTMADKHISWTPTLSPMLSFLQSTPNQEIKNVATEILSNLADKISYAQQNGISILAGTDTLPPGSLQIEINALSNYGLSPLEALQSATITPRKVFNKPIFEEGAPADLLIYNINPIEELEKAVNPNKIFFGGKIITSD